MIRKLLYSPLVLFCCVLLFGCEAVENPDGGVLPYSPPNIARAQIVLDRTVYAGYSHPASVVVQDTNNTNSFISVEVTSLSDPVGITMLLSNSGTNFIGTLWFTNSNSVAGQTIKATNNDQLRLVYDEPDPNGKRIKYTQWFETFGYDIYDSVVYRGFVIEAGYGSSYNLGFLEHAKTPGYGTSIMGGATTYYDAAYTSGQAKQFYLENTYFYVVSYSPVDLSLFRNGYFCLTLAATNNLDIKLVWSGGASAIVKAADYMTLDNTPHHLRIPLSDFVGLDMSQFSGFFIAWMRISRTYFVMEEVRLEL